MRRVVVMEPGAGAEAVTRLGLEAPSICMLPRCQWLHVNVRGSSNELVGVVPAAGRATRLGRLPCSKEVLPIAWETDPAGRSRALVACEPLLRQMRLAGAMRAFVVVGNGKWDIPAFLGDGDGVGLDLAYLVIADSPSMVHTVARACPRLGTATVLFGFPGPRAAARRNCRTYRRPPPQRRCRHRSRALFRRRPFSSTWLKCRARRCVQSKSSH